MGRGDLVPRILTEFGVLICLSEAQGVRRAWPGNLSETGACVRIKDPAQKGQSVRLRIQLGKNTPKMELAGRIVWVRHDSIHDVDYCGVGFENLSADQLRQIRTYVERGGESLLNFLSEFPHFADFSQEDCRQLLQITTLRELEKGEILYQENTDDVDLQGLFIVESGLLNIYKGRKPRPERQLAAVSPGQIFGETTLILDQPHSATIAAVIPSRLIQIHKLGFHLMRSKNPSLALKIMEVAARALAIRLGRTTKRLFSPIEIE